MNQLVSTSWLNDNLDKVKILDASWHLPNVKRDSFQEFKKNHIKNSFFFDIDKNSNQKTNLPHMLPSKEDWQIIVSNLGIKNSDHIIVYDNSDVFSSCRVWYTFLYFGHDPNLISVLDGNFEKWLIEKRPVTQKLSSIIKSNYVANENVSLVINKNQVNQNIIDKKFQLIDARGEKRFKGLEPEPRKELRSGNIEGSINLPFKELINETLKQGKRLHDSLASVRKYACACKLTDIIDWHTTVEKCTQEATNRRATQLADDAKVAAENAQSR